MSDTHTHSGVVRSDSGKLRSHSMTQQHKDKRVINYHNLSIKGMAKKFQKYMIGGSSIVEKNSVSKSWKQPNTTVNSRPIERVKTETKTKLITQKEVSIDLTEQPEVTSLKVTFKDINRKKVTITIPNYS